MTTLSIFVSLGKHGLLCNIMLCRIQSCCITESLYDQTMFASRMCSGVDNILALPSTFIDNLLGTSVPQWTQQLKHCAIDIFSCNMIILPFRHNGNTSFFVVIGAKHIKDYMKTDFSETRPCILHILPYATTTQGHKHAYNQAVTRLRVWLNALWRTTRGNNVFDVDSMPFNSRSLPFRQPRGECFQ